MLDQIRVFKLVDKIDVKLSEAAGKLTRIMLLAELLAKKYGDRAKDCTDEQLRAMAGLRGSRKQRSKPARNKTWEVDAIIGARLGGSGREYLVRWVMEIEPGEQWETWEPYSVLLVQDEEGEWAVNQRLDDQVAQLDTLTPEEELELAATDQTTLDAETAVLAVGDRVLHDRGDDNGGFCAGSVSSISESGQLSVRLDSERQPLLLERSQALFKAPEPTALKKGDVIRIAFDDNALEGTMRWEYGKVVKVHTGKELLDIDLDNGQQLRAAPLYDVCAVR